MTTAVDTANYGKDRLVYAVCFSEYRWNKKHTRRLWYPEVEYLHADSKEDAVYQFCIAYPNRQTHKVLEAGIAIGHFIDEKSEYASMDA